MAQTEIGKIVDVVKKYIELEEMSGINEIILSSQKEIKESDFSLLRKEAFLCQNCELHKTRRNVVFGSGNPHAKLMFVGEAPGMEEDIQGVPFVGRAGQLLTKIIEAIKLKRKDVYIANVLKCRPPNNRNPLPTEILTCEDYLIRQISLIKPKVICALGKFAAQTLLRTETPISRLRGKFQDYHGVMLMPTYHPAYLLRNPKEKRSVWEDMKKIQKILRQKP